MASQWGLRGCCWRVMGGDCCCCCRWPWDGSWLHVLAMPMPAWPSSTHAALFSGQPPFWRHPQLPAASGHLHRRRHRCRLPEHARPPQLTVARPARGRHRIPHSPQSSPVCAFPVHPQQALPPQPQSQVSNPCGGASCMPFADSGPCCRDWLVDHTSLQTPNSNSNPNNARRLRQTATKFILLPADLGLTTRRQPPSILT